MFLRVEIVRDWQDLGFWFKVGQKLLVEVLEGSFYGYDDFLIAKDYCKII